jgi:hypothetical protein
VSGHVFHPGHDALHGVTVLLETTERRSYIGRLDTEDESGMHLLDVAVHEAENPDVSKEEFVRRALTFGVRAQHKHVVVPSAHVTSIRPLGELAG